MGRWVLCATRYLGRHPCIFNIMYFCLHARLHYSPALCLVKALDQDGIKIPQGQEIVANVQTFLSGTSSAPVRLKEATR